MEGEPFFFYEVEATDRIPVLQWMALHPYIYRQH